jgi:hypothetical protein
MGCENPTAPVKRGNSKRMERNIFKAFFTIESNLTP